jgi:predicted permease
MSERSPERGTRPPDIAEGILSWLLPEEDRGPILGDLAEEYVRRAQSDGVRAARSWYRRQVLRAVFPAIKRRRGRRTNERPEGMAMDGGKTMGERLGVSWLDVKLGLRMVRKRPVMTGAAIFALAVGIPASMVPGHIARVLEAPLPEDAGDRIRAVRYWDQAVLRATSPTYYEFARWRDELNSFETVSAFRGGKFNVRTGQGQTSVIQGAELSASVFGLLGAVPQLGRTLDSGDETPGAPDVALVSDEFWRNNLAADREVVGTTLEIGGVPHIIVGVMQESFRFPSQQQVWVALREELIVEPAQGRSLSILARLADGVTPEAAQAEVAASAVQIAGEFPATNQRMAGEVVRFGTADLGLSRGGWRTSNDHLLFSGLALILLTIAAGNVAMLLFAGTATRFRELAIRTSLGASRRRIVTPMFVESPVLAVSSAGLGLVALHLPAEYGRARLLQAQAGDFPPYWMEFGVTTEMVVGALLVAVLSASIAGVLPALKVTGSRVQESIRRAEAGRSGIRFGGVTTLLIVVDVAFAVAVLGLGVGIVEQVLVTLDADERVGIAADEYLEVELTLPAEEFVGGGGELRPEEFRARWALTQQTLVDRLESEARVRGVAVGDRLPRQDHISRRSSIEGETSWTTVEGRPGSPMPPLLPVARVDVDFFDALGQPMVAGRGFDQADLADSASTAIVNAGFVERRFGGRNPIGQRIRFWTGNTPANIQPEERWYEIVGVVGQLGMNVAMPAQDGGIYLPAAPGELHPMMLAIHLDGTPESFSPRLGVIVSVVVRLAIMRQRRRLGDVGGVGE